MRIQCSFLPLKKKKAQVSLWQGTDVFIKLNQNHL